MTYGPVQFIREPSVLLADNLHLHLDKCISLLTLLGLSEVFDAVDHLVLFDLLASQVVRGTTLSWFSLFLWGHYQRTAIEEERAS